jgi:hypothetical protein
VPMASVAAASVFYLVRKGSAAKKSCSELEWIGPTCGSRPLLHT